MCCSESTRNTNTIDILSETSPMVETNLDRHYHHLFNAMDAVGPSRRCQSLVSNKLSLLVSGGDQAKQASLFSPNRVSKLLSLPVDKDANTTDAPFSLERPTLFRPTQTPRQCRMPTLHSRRLICERPPRVELSVHRLASILIILSHAGSNCR